MSRVFKPTYTRRLPLLNVYFDAGGRPFVEIAGKPAPVTLRDGAAIATCTGRVFVAEFRDADGKLVTRSTKCRTEAGARRVLAAWERDEDAIRSGLRTRADTVARDEAARPVEEHLGEYVAALRARRRSANYWRRVEGRLRRVFADLRPRRLADLTRPAVERWLDALTTHPRAGPPRPASTRTRNAYRDDLATFLEWARTAGRAAVNPLADVPKLQRVRVRPRRALTRDEFARLCAAAPPARTLLYRVLLLTGLRVDELRTLTVGRLDLDATPPVISLEDTADKSRRGDEVIVAADLVPVLRQLAAGKPATARLLRVPSSLLRYLNRDLEAAGIPKVDDRGRSVDLHALRRTLATWLAAAGTAPKVAQRVLRHRSIAMTLDVYTDPDTAAAAGAVDGIFLP